jgi:acetyl-CoA acyltransferase
VKATVVSNGSSGHAAKAKTTTSLFETDEGPRADTSMEALAKLKPAFHARGTTTAGNSSQTSDGAAAAIVMSAEKARALGAKPMARFLGFATAGVPAEIMGIGPAYAIPKVLKLVGLKLDQIDVIELNEAFAVQSLAVIQEAGLDPARINPNGGAIALGHPSVAPGRSSRRQYCANWSGAARDTAWSPCALAGAWARRGFLSVRLRASNTKIDEL